MGESVFLGCKSLSTLKKSLGIFENDAWTEGGKRVYVQLQDGKKGLAPLVKWTSENAAIYDFLLTKGYADVSGCMNLKTGGYESVLMKEMQPEGQTNPLTIQFDGDDENLPVLFENFGLFIRDSNGIAKGGLWGNLEQYASQPHTHINIFYIDGSIRGTGLGLILMDLVEDYAKSHGIKLLALETCEFQAPKFYEKFGYKRVQTIPKSFKDREGRCQVLK
jgi:N-acetylglutamate synthase-like GNAT family acetyltransferase